MHHSAANNNRQTNKNATTQRRTKTYQAKCHRLPEAVGSLSDAVRVDRTLATELDDTVHQDVHVFTVLPGLEYPVSGLCY